MTFPQLQEADLPSLYGMYYPRKSLTAVFVAQQATDTVSLRKGIIRWFSGTGNQGQYYVRPRERVLDIGCGSGLSLLEARARGAEVWGIEADPNVQPIAAELGLRVHQGSLNDRPFPGQTFDLVILNQVVEHLPQPDLALRQIRERLAPGGRVILVFPNIRSVWCRLSGAKWINWHIPYHLHHFERKSFARMAERCGFEVRHVKTITPSLWTLLQVRACLATVQRGERSGIWGGTAEVASPAGSMARRSGTGSAKRLFRAGLVAALLVLVMVINRIIDAAGRGDSLLVELKPEDRA